MTASGRSSQAGVGQQRVETGYPVIKPVGLLTNRYRPLRYRHLTQRKRLQRPGDLARSRVV
jgi:hypothetical protein